MAKWFPVLAVFLMLFLSSIAFADNFVIDAKADKDITLPTEVVTFNVTVTSNLTADQKVDVVLSGAHTEWLTQNVYELTLKPTVAQSFAFYVAPTYGTQPRTYSYNITIKAKDAVNVSSEKAVYFYVAEKEFLQITSFSPTQLNYLPVETITLTTRIKNAGTKEAEDYTLNLTLMDKINSTALPRIEINEEQSFTQTFTVDKFTAKGNYTVKAEAIDKKGKVVDRNSTIIKIVDKAAITKTKTVDEKILYIGVALSATNDGNKKDTVVFSEPLPAVMFLYSFDKAPTIANNSMIWSCELNPGESCSINYRANYWILIIVILVIGVAIGMLFKEIERPTIKKKVSRKKDRYTVHLEVHNRGPRDLLNVEVLDSLPSLTKLLGEFSIEPNMIKKVKGGVAILWKIGRLEAREARVFSYDVRPELEIEGGITLPKAKIRAENPHGFKYSSESAEVKIG